MSYSGSVRRPTKLLVLMLTTLSLLAVVTPQVCTQESDLTASSYQVFNQLADIYKSSGTAPDLVANLNVALAQIQEAQIKRSQGDQAGANMLEDQARSTLASIQNAIPAAQQKAQRDSFLKTLFVIALIPIVVIVSTFVFYAALRAWRWYEKEKLFEMRIVEKKKDEG